MVYSWNIFLNLTNSLFISIYLTTDNSPILYQIVDIQFAITPSKLL